MVLFVALASAGGCKKKVEEGGGGGTVTPVPHQASIQALEALVFAPGKPADGNEVERLANQIAQEIILKATEGAKAKPEQIAMQALMAWGSAQGVLANDGKYSAPDAKVSWLKLRDDNFAPAPWFKH